MIHVRIKSLPLDSATAIAEGSGGWTLAHYLAAQAVEVQTGKPHPGKPEIDNTPTPAASRARKDALARKRERERLIAEGLI